jgi:hypothetical protein
LVRVRALRNDQDAVQGSGGVGRQLHLRRLAFKPSGSGDRHKGALVAVLAVIDGVADLMCKDADGTRSVIDLGTDEDFIDASLAGFATPALADPSVGATAPGSGTGNPHRRGRETALGEACRQVVCGVP